MPRPASVALFLVAAAWTAGVAFVACAPAKASRAHEDADAAGYGTDDPGEPVLPPPRPPDYDDPDSSALGGAGERGRDAAGPKPEAGARPPAEDAGVPPPPPPPTDGGVTTPPQCPNPLGQGDLAIVEFMIQSQAGPGDRGEWVEIQSTRNCNLNVRGLHVESPRGAGPPDAVDVTDDLILPPNGTLIVADTLQPDLNHNLPGTVLSWNATDALKNDGDTIRLSVGGQLVDALTYGSWVLHVGRTVSFPVDCTWSQRSDWARWSWSFHVWQDAPDGGVPMKGTPNADNDDVTCF
jgi:hypothetical protein